ncbi:acetyltransferase [Albibacterium bauzanense]|uniref:Sugar O-acyltransferase (Sialic acid O-acetyltransferase NeuD family) n=1 Tax=Albibacterium bauzanense TaxID=653929 RepID=A0A4R1M584_9SPHI|nr:acetyltransferase [Albibacterium bauzanense]TCK84903.1 sugar O-acyltransferase (sialic acid O-acetyltransferase NeuD family) [Albibacterium bauzanense]
MKRLAIIGSGDLGQQIAYHAQTDNHYEVIGFFDDFRNKGERINDLPILGKTNAIIDAFQQKIFDELLIGIGYKHLVFKREIYQKFKNKIPFGKLIHSSSILDSSSIIKEGVVIYPGCIIDQQVIIEENTLINVGCCIAHDTKIGAHSFLSPRVAIAGFVKVGESCILGINSTIIDNIQLVNNTQIGGGAVVIKNIEQEGLYVGNPVRFIR